MDEETIRATFREVKTELAGRDPVEVEGVEPHEGAGGAPTAKR